MSIRLLVLSVLATATLAGSAIAAEPAPKRGERVAPLLRACASTARKTR